MVCCCDDIWNSLMFDQLLISLCIEVGHEILVKIEFFDVIVHWKYGSKSRFKGNEKSPISAGFIHFDWFLRIFVLKKGMFFFVRRRFLETCQNIVSQIFSKSLFNYSLVVMVSTIDQILSKKYVILIKTFISLLIDTTKCGYWRIIVLLCLQYKK